MAALKVKLEIQIMPWKRCLASVLAHNTIKIDAFYNGNRNAERLERYILSAAVYKTHHGYAFLKTNKHIPNTLAMVGDMNVSPKRKCPLLIAGGDVTEEFITLSHHELMSF